MEPLVRLRRATQEDEPILFEAYAGSRAPEMQLVPWSLEQKRAFLHHQYQIQRRFYDAEYAGSVCSVILADGRPVGRLWVDHREDEMRILDLAIVPAERGKGIGTRILKDLQNKARAKQRPVRVHVEHYQSSLGLFEKLGFKVARDDGVTKLLEWAPAPTTGTVELRPAIEADSDFFLALYTELREPELRAVGWDRDQIRSFCEMQHQIKSMSYRANYPDADHSVILHDRERVGELRVDRTGETITLVDITIMTQARNRGIGTRILKELLEEAGQAGASVRLTVAVRNPARRLYERLGFRTVTRDEINEHMEWGSDP